MTERNEGGDSGGNGCGQGGGNGRSPEEAPTLGAVPGGIDADPDATMDRRADGSYGLSAEATARLAAALRETVGSKIGPYKLLQQIGEGGFGSVFMAEQSEPVKRRVALKIIKLGMDTREVVARFEQERQALAVMDHPNIARVLDAGATETGRPFFVMELVKGDPIVDFCDKNNLSIRERLELFAQVCRAVQHAHTKGIIHRDIKPSNILVSSVDGNPSAKVIDFGIAKATASRLTERTLFTEHRQLIGTPEYMSPEQAEGSLDIDTRSDVYSLGVLLYELLTGSTPFGGETLRSAAYAEIQRIIREVDPPRPSTRLSQNAGTLASVAAKRKTEPGRLGPTIRGELDWIVMKALEKDRGRRYETANGLGQDVMRYLNGEAVLAAPTGAGYRLKKIVRRHKGAVVAGSVVAASLVLGIAGTAWQARAASIERDEALAARESEARQRREADGQRDRAVAAEARAQSRATELAAVSEFQSSILRQIDSTRAGEALTADLRSRYAESLKTGVPEEQRGVMMQNFSIELGRVNATDAAAAMMDVMVFKPSLAAIEEKFKDQPLVEASLRHELAEQYEVLGLYEAALVQEELSLATRRRILGDAHEDTASSVSNLGVLLETLGKYAEAERCFEEALATRRALLGEDHRRTLISKGNLGNYYRVRGQLDKAEPLLRETLVGSRRTHGDKSRDTLIAMNTLGFLHISRGNAVEAEPLWREAYTTGKASFGPDDRDVLVWQNNLAGLLQMQGKMDEAEELLLAALAGHIRVYGDAHPSTARVMSTLSGHYIRRGNYDKAETLSRDSLSRLERLMGRDDRTTVMARTDLANALRSKGDLSGAEPLVRSCLESLRRLNGPDHQDTLVALANLGRLHVAQNKFAEAEAEYREAMERSTRGMGAEHPDTLVSMVNLVGVLVERRKLDEGLELARRTLEIRRRVSGPENPETLIVMSYIARVLEFKEKPAEAEVVFREVLTGIRRAQGETHMNTLSAKANLAGVLRTLGRVEEAEPLWREAIAGYEQRLGKVNHVRLAGTHEGLGKTLMDLGRFEQAEAELLVSYQMYGVAQGVTPERRNNCAGVLQTLYETWDKAQPGKGHDAKAAEWKLKASGT